MPPPIATTEPRPLWTITQTADYLGVSMATVYRWIRVGEGPPCGRAGSHLRFRPEDVEAWFDANMKADS